MITRVILINSRSGNEVATILIIDSRGTYCVYYLCFNGTGLSYIKLFLLFPGINLVLLLCSNTYSWFKQKASQNRGFVRTPRTPPGYGPVNSILLAQLMATLIHYTFTLPLSGLVDWSAFLERLLPTL